MDLTGVPVQPTTNYLVPSSGGTHCVPVTAAWTPQPAILDWRQFSESSFPFQPQGVFIDNTLNPNPLTITINPIGWNVVCPAFGQLMTPFPAPLSQTASVTSSGAGGTATLMFVDFPVLPFQSSANGLGASVTIANLPLTTLPSNVATALALSTQPVSNVQLVTAPGEWTLTNAAAVSVQATATRVAGAAGVRHVLKSIQASLNAVAAQAAPVIAVVRDGLTGAGTILWQDRLMAPIGFTDRISVDGLNIVGSAATAMTIEFTAAPTATNFETISASGYDAQ
jgi:hypothetical protein